MTIARERSNAIRTTRNFLRSLLVPQETPNVPKWIRNEAYWCLKHFPSDLDINQEVTFGGSFELLEYDEKD